MTKHFHTLLERLLPPLVLLGGLLGIAACLGGIAAAWMAGERLTQASEVVFQSMDQSLAAIRERLLGAKERVQALKITTEDIRQTLEERMRQEAGQRLATEFDVPAKAERLSAGLQEADQYLELAAEIVQSVRQVMVIGTAVGAAMDTTIVDDVDEQITSLRSQLQQVTGTVEGIRAGTAEIAVGEPLPERLNQFVRLTLRVVATLGEIDVRLRRATDRMSAAQARSQELQAKTLRWIFIGQVVVVLAFAWFAAGQAALCGFGWRHFRRSSLPGSESTAA